MRFNNPTTEVPYPNASLYPEIFDMALIDVEKKLESLPGNGIRFLMKARQILETCLPKKDSDENYYLNKNTLSVALSLLFVGSEALINISEAIAPNTEWLVHATSTEDNATFSVYPLENMSGGTYGDPKPDLEPFYSTSIPKQDIFYIAQTFVRPQGVKMFEPDLQATITYPTKLEYAARRIYRTFASDFINTLVDLHILSEDEAVNALKEVYNRYKNPFGSVKYAQELLTIEE